ncbi:MAG: hypothetical protein KGN84_16635 [Acidobacteriota bacterium]|nr:hypothetical protein [Acidobacteriota bacterium]
MKLVLPALLITASALAQEAGAGFDLRMTLSGAADYPTSGSVEGGYRAVLYPTWKLNSHWSVTGAFQINSANFFTDAAAPTPYLAKGYLLQGSLNYSRVRGDRSLLVRVGELSSAFGSFLLRYDDMQNPLIGLPEPYGYYYAAVSTLAVAGAQVDATWGRWDARAQFANSSPANPRAIVSGDQYGNWSGGAGFTIRQGFRVGGSAYYGPYLSRESPFFSPREAPPNTLPARAAGIDAQWARGQWNLQGEWQKFSFPYAARPEFRLQAGYFEVKRVLGPRWYAASRFNNVSASFGGPRQIIETVAGFRPSGSTLLKFGYVWEHRDQGTTHDTGMIEIQLVASVHPLTAAFR